MVRSVAPISGLPEIGILNAQVGYSRLACDASRTMGHRRTRHNLGRHASRACPTCASIVPLSGKPEIGVLRDACPRCARTGPQDEGGAESDFAALNPGYTLASFCASLGRCH